MSRCFTIILSDVFFLEIAFLVIFYVVISKVLFLTSLGGNDPF